MHYDIAEIRHVLHIINQSGPRSTFQVPKSGAQKIEPVSVDSLRDVIRPGVPPFLKVAVFVKNSCGNGGIMQQINQFL